jgi:hypothetical protein
LPGPLFHILDVDKDNREITLTADASWVDVSSNPRIRRWDQSGPQVITGDIPLPVDLSGVNLENGIQVSFQAGYYQSGDYWTIPARTAAGVEWPPCGSDGVSWQLPTSLTEATAPLACVHWIAGAEDNYPIEDCRRVFTPLTGLRQPRDIPAIHVRGINWANDDVMTLDQLVANGGLTISLDQPVPGPVNGGNFVVTLEQTSSSYGLVATGHEFTYTFRSPVIMDFVTVPGETLTWQVPEAGVVIDHIQQMLLSGLEGSGSAFGRVRVRLCGQAIVGSGATGPVYLDGKTFGKPALRQDGSTQRMDLQFPSGDGSVASDFESWFYLAPYQAITGISAIPTDLVTVVDASGNLRGVEDANSLGTLVSPYAEVAMLYPPTADTSINLALTSDAPGNETFAIVPPTMTAPRGELYASVPIAIVASPASGVRVTFTLTATLPAATAALSSTQSAQFTVTGGQVPIP